MGEFHRYVIMRLIRYPSDAVWTLVIRDWGMRDQTFISPETGGENAPPFLGSPRLEADLQEIFLKTEEVGMFGLPSVEADPNSLTQDTVARRNLARYLAPFDADIRQIVDEEGLDQQSGGLYNSLAVALVDSLDSARGWRKGELEIQVREDTWRGGSLPRWKKGTIELFFARVGHDAPWRLLALPSGMETDSSRSNFHAQMARAEQRIRSLFPDSINLKNWRLAYQRAQNLN